ncbi:MAG: M23 family metallopeptidase [Proteobacteria bacterium]|nr:M23 family metallopeptidase [Pseudomonadota bacterium]MBP7607857.1 M23 family metallopeptidase [Steroidobacteraceae bacterium]
MAFIIFAAGPMATCRMRTIGAGRALSGLLAITLVLMAGCIALGYLIAQGSTIEPGLAAKAAAGNVFDAKRTEGRAVIDRIGDLSGRLIRLEIEAAALARRLGVAPSTANIEPGSAKPAVDDRPRGGPLLPLGNTAPMTGAAAHSIAGEPGSSLGYLETEIALLEASLDRMAGLLDDRDLATMTQPNRPPVPGRMPKISSGFGVRHDPFTGRLARHMGLDIPAVHGAAILASGGGRVISAGYRGPYGKAIVIDHGHGTQTLYGHCSVLYVRAGDLVLPRQKIAAVGSTGRSTGPHLHFEVIRSGKRIEPGQVLADVLARNPN